MLSVTNLSKQFNQVRAVKNISFHVKKGELFSFLGTNGAGKSTVISMIIQLLKPDTGQIHLAKGARLGVVFQSHRLDKALTLEENLLLRARLYRIDHQTAKKRLDYLFNLLGLSHKRQTLYGVCSGGEKRKADIIRALLNQPTFLILDEPTTGLDAESRQEIWIFLHYLKETTNLTLFLTTHYIEEAEDSDYILIMHQGKVITKGTPYDLKKNYAKASLKLEAKDKERLKQHLRTKTDLRFEINHQTFLIYLQTSKEAITLLHSIQDLISAFTLNEGRLEDVFLNVTKQEEEKGAQ